MANTTVTTTKVLSPRDRTIAAKSSYDTSVKALTPKDDLDTRADKLKSELGQLNTLISAYQDYVTALKTAHGAQADIDAAQASLDFYKAKLPELDSEVQLATIRASVSKTNFEDIGNGIVLADAALAERATNWAANVNSHLYGALSYNASAVKEAYFSQKVDFIERIQAPNNQPKTVAQASQLWTSASGSKGMIVTSEQVLSAWNSGSNKPTTAGADHHNYGFQFQYNPGTVGMSYYTSPNVDVTMMTSGQEMFNLAGVSSSQGSVSFQVVINRIFDMQYYKGDGSLKAGVDGNSIYPVPPKDTADYLNIYNKGTMYDVEYLLRVLMGTTMNSYLRGEYTADMGWLPAIPVELHLGKSLRYLGIVDTLNLNHIIFDSRMVPIFTTMDISFRRLPDYPTTNAAVLPELTK